MKTAKIITFIIVGLVIIGIVGYNIINTIIPVNIITHVMTHKPKYNKNELGTIYKDITYKEQNGQEQKLDIYMPLDNSNKNIPVTVFIHGGAWIKGDKEEIFSTTDVYDVIDKLRNSGYAVISINYSLLSESAHFPDNIKDCKDSIRWIRKSASKYSFDSNNIGVWGPSAGGHLALMVGLTNDTSFVGDKKLSQYSSKVNYIIDHYGPTNLSEHLGLNGDKNMTKTKESIIPIAFENAKIGSKEFNKLCEENSATNYVTKDSPPVLIIHGLNDSLVNVIEGQMLLEKINNVNGTVKSWFIKDIDHVFSGASNKELEDIVNMTVDFAKKYTINNN